MKGGKVVLFSRPVRSGKTTELLEWCKSRTDVGGLLSPDKDGIRWFYDISSQEWHPFEMAGPGTGSISVGRFHFSEAAFSEARSRLTALAGINSFLAIDEVGKLELHRAEGLEPVIGELITGYLKQQYDGTLLLVVRDTLLNELIKKYSLEQAAVINTLTLYNGT
ncbi:MAG: hypothetical protein EOP49_12320 [Sphingobacteriales bacterium]|nr:MAG: hypothetical protein EOP49_12320 [Sphingobacteriales bacterium]